MRPIYYDLAIPGGGGAISPPLPLDTYISPGNMIFTVALPSGPTGATVAIQHTNDDIYAPNYNPSTGNWENFTATPFPVNLTAADPIAEGAYAFAPRAVRFVVTAVTSASYPFNLSIQLIQAGIGGT